MTLIHRLVVSPPPKNMCQLRWLFPIYGKIKAMFQTTNQSTINQSAKYGRFQATHFVHPRRSRTTRGWHRVDGSAALARSVVCYVLFTENQWDICDIFMNSGLLWFVMKIMWTFEIYEPIHRTWWRSMMNGTWWTFFILSGTESIWGPNVVLSLQHQYMTGGQHYLLHLTTRDGHGQSGWSPIGCEGLYLHAICKNRVSVSGRSPIGCECFRKKLNIPCTLPTTLVFR